MIDEKVLIEVLNKAYDDHGTSAETLKEELLKNFKDLASEHNNGWIEKLLKAKKNCGEDSDCSECPFGQIEDRCILQELQIEKDVDFCEWRKENSNKYVCDAHAEIHDSRVLDWCVCPYCGKEIKVITAPYKKGE